MKRIIKFIARSLLAALANFYLVLAGWLPRYRGAAYEAMHNLGWRSRPTPPPSGPELLIPSIRVKDLIPNPPPVRIFEPDVANGNVAAEEILVIAQLVASRNVTKCFEIGTFDGRTTLNLAANAGAQPSVFTLDLPAADLDRTAHPIAPGDQSFINKPKSGARFTGTEWESRITQLYGDSATFDFAPYEGKMDLVFVDGSHSYDYVKTDTATALRLIRPGGMILWHDYGSKWWKDLTRAMNELHADRPELAGMRHIRGTTLVIVEAGMRAETGNLKRGRRDET